MEPPRRNCATWMLHSAACCCRSTCGGAGHLSRVGQPPRWARSAWCNGLAHLATRFSALVQGLSGDAASDREMREARRLLYALDAVIALHLAAEEEMLAQ